ncbi:MAG TPA: 2-dehydropantoate 2-reductase [Desulfobulbaceae bacterium]|nr:2-dehydropantoate 2-reductase [Desulfobulbaceae bacterium]
MHIVIVGPGALGSLLTARLSLYLAGQGKGRADSDHQVSLLDYKPQRAALLARGGLVLEEGDRRQHCTPAVAAAPEVCAGADVLFLCVKAAAVRAALDRIRPFLSSEQLILAMQNGIAHLELLTALPCMPGVGITTEGATLLAPGRVRHGGAGLTRLGLLPPATAAAHSLLDRTTAVLKASGLAVRITHAPLKHVWAKLFINVGINALTALLRCPNGVLLDSLETRERMTMAVREAEAVARASGIPIDEDPLAATLKVCKATGTNISSMLQDISNRRRTEIDAINGAVVAAGSRLGIPTPVNAELVRQVKELESEFAGAEEGWP